MLWLFIASSYGYGQDLKFENTKKAENIGLITGSKKQFNQIFAHLSFRDLGGWNSNILFYWRWQYFCKTVSLLNKKAILPFLSLYIRPSYIWASMLCIPSGLPQASIQPSAVPLKSPYNPGVLSSLFKKRRWWILGKRRWWILGNSRTWNVINLII